MGWISFRKTLRNGAGCVRERGTRSISRAFPPREIHKVDSDCINQALTRGDIRLINEFISSKDVVDKFVNGDPCVFYEILRSAIIVHRGGLERVDNVDKTYDDITIRLIGAAKEVHFGLFHGRSLLMWALQTGKSYKIIDELIKAGSDVNAVSCDLMSPLMYAVIYGNDVKVIAELLNHGANINYRNRSGWTPLFYSFSYRYNWPDLSVMLLKAGLSVHDLDDEGRNVLMSEYCYCYDGSDCGIKQSFHVLLKYGFGEIDLKHTDNEGNTILHLTHCKYVFELALKSGVSIESKNNDGRTPLLKTLQEYLQLFFERKLVYLLKSGADVNSTDLELQTALHLYALNNATSLDTHVLDMLIYYGGNMYARNSNNQTPLDIMIENNGHLIFVIPMHIILFDDDGLDATKKAYLENLIDSAKLSSFAIECKKELTSMQETFIAEDLTVYEFCVLKRYCRSKCVNIPFGEYKYSCSEIKQLFPICEDVIIIRMKDNRLKKRELDLRKRFEKITFSSVHATETDLHQVLNYDCLYHIGRYLNYEEMFNIFSAAIVS